MQNALRQFKIGLNDDDIFGKPVIPEILQCIAIDNFVPILRYHRGRFIIVRRGEFQQQVLRVRVEDTLHRVFPVVKQLLLRFRLDVDVVRFICQKHNLLLGEILKGERVLLHRRQICVQLLNRREADVDGVFIDTLKISHLCHLNAFAIKKDVFAEEIFGGERVEEVVLRLLNDIGGIDEEEEVAVTLLIEVEHQPCHDKRLAAACRHVKEKVQRFFLAIKFLVEAKEEPRERVLLIRTEFKRRIEVFGEVSGDFGGLEGAPPEFLNDGFV